METFVALLSWKNFVILIGFVLLSCCQLSLGYWVFTQAHISLRRLANRFFSSSLSASSQQPPLLSFHKYVGSFLLLGLLVHLISSILLKSLGLPWWSIVSWPLIMLWICRQQWRGVQVRLSNVLSFLHPSWCVWWIGIVVIGATLFSMGKGIQTPWMNNYGDLAFHLGMITSFTYGPAFPPEYHLFAGETLSYPFLVNLWTALVWSWIPEMETLPMVFFLQWVLLWSIVFFALNGKRFWYLPWLLLLGGGSYVAIALKPMEWSWRLIGEGYPWTTLLSTVWVTQRSALMGAAVSATIIALVFSYIRQCGTLNTPSLNLEADQPANKSKKGSQQSTPVMTMLSEQQVALAGVLLALSPLVHTHFFIITSLFCGALLFLPSAFKTIRPKPQWISANATWQTRFLSFGGKEFLILFVLACFAVVFFPMLTGKSGMIQMMYGWVVPFHRPAQPSHIWQSLFMWLSNAGHWIFVMVLMWLLSQRHFMFSLLLGLFLLGNAVLLSGWEWDQIKVFLAIYLVFLMIWSQLDDVPIKRVGLLCAILLAGPGAYELYRVYQDKPMFTVYDQQRVAMASLIKDYTEADDILAVAPDHNSLGTLTGRHLFMGYTGTLASHKIDYGQREKVLKDLSLLQSCFSRFQALNLPRDVCPQYLVWDEAAKRFWKRQNPGDGFKPVHFDNKVVKAAGYRGQQPFLYSLKGQ